MSIMHMRLFSTTWVVPAIHMPQFVSHLEAMAAPPPCATGVDAAGEDAAGVDAAE
jgi:hypothetical protein